MAGLVPAIHALPRVRKTRMPWTSPGTTTKIGERTSLHNIIAGVSEAIQNVFAAIVSIASLRSQ
jgi:hypothetical protein